MTLAKQEPSDTTESVRKLRSRFEEEVKENGSLYDAKDLERLEKSDWDFERFLLHSKGNLEDAFEGLKQRQQWRKSFGVNQLKATDFPQEFYLSGSFFAYSRDVEGNLMVYLRGKLHRKMPEWSELFKKFFVFVVNDIEQQTGGRKYALVWDCEGAGLQNVDLNILSFMAKTISNYFPYGVEYILLYDMPWVLHAIYALAKSWVPDYFQKIVQFTDKTEVINRIGLDNLPDYMGGTCPISYKEVPEGSPTAQEVESLLSLPDKAAFRLRAHIEQHSSPSSWFTGT